ncbi:hypothetical protein [Blastococcus montanus]|uniref:hypothetical protein n=1 Tax=Blastococcus montanus TaxID=3144973 RepID=UPI0032095F62
MRLAGSRPRGGTGPEPGGIALGEPAGTGGALVLLFSADLPRGRRFDFRDPGANELGVWAEG